MKVKRVFLYKQRVTTISGNRFFSYLKLHWLTDYFDQKPRIVRTSDFYGKTIAFVDVVKISP
jgi:hypothetical protein